MSNHGGHEHDGPRLRTRLRSAVRGVETPPFLAARIRRDILAEAAPTRRRGWVLATAGAAGLLGATVAYQLGHPRFPVASQESFIASATHQVATLMRVGLSDHLHCAHFRKLPRNPPPMEEFVRQMGPEYAALIPVVASHAPQGARLELAHRCRDGERLFVHLAWKDGSRLHSLILTRKQAGESFQVEGLLPALVRSGLPVYQAGAKGFEIAGFESRDHLVYLVSNDSRDSNGGRLLAMAPGVRQVLSGLEL